MDFLREKNPQPPIEIYEWQATRSLISHIDQKIVTGKEKTIRERKKKSCSLWIVFVQLALRLQEKKIVYSFSVMIFIAHIFSEVIYFIFFENKSS